MDLDRYSVKYDGLEGRIKDSRDAISNLGISLNGVGRLNGLLVEERIKEYEGHAVQYAGEGIEDWPVSNRFSYWRDFRGDLFSDESFREAYRITKNGRVTNGRFFDLEEREGLPARGFVLAMELVFRSEDGVVLHYSPSGPGTYSDSGYGQLYIYRCRGNRVDGVAAKVKNEGVLKELMPGVFESAQNSGNEVEKIRTYLLNPVATLIELEEFLGQRVEKCWAYIGMNGKIYDLDYILKEVGDLFFGKVRKPVYVSDEIIRDTFGKEKIGSGDLIRFHENLVKSYAILNGLREVNLGASCGGKVVSVLDDSSGAVYDVRGGGGISNGKNPLLSGELKIRNKERYVVGDCSNCPRTNVIVGPCGWCLECEEADNRKKSFGKDFVGAINARLN